MKVQEIMRQGLVTVSPDAAMREAAALMRRRQVRHLLVIDEQGALIGILTDRDLEHSSFLPFLAPYVVGGERKLRKPRVRDVMTLDVVTVEQDVDLVRAALLMFERRIGSLPITDRGKLVGIVTGRDVLEALQDDASDGSNRSELYLG
ncbi:MAG TPA: CBS domain-containing protein [Tepidisphaeraceae bacterium]|jgi:acetoin utilization protein AcuB